MPMLALIQLILPVVSLETLTYTLARLHTMPGNVGKKNYVTMWRQVLQQPYNKLHHTKIEKQ